MNEKLKHIISETWYNGSVTDTSDMDHVDYENIAEHFYNLALEDVRKEVEEHKHLLKCESEYTNYAGGRLDEAKDILDYIDNLTK